MNDVYDWLTKNAGPVINYRTHKELKEEDASDFEGSLVSSKMVLKQLELLKLTKSPNSLHNSKPEAFENCMGRLYEFGMRKGIESFNVHIQPYLDWFEDLSLSKGNPAPFSWFYLSLIAGYLTMTGYSTHKEVDYVIRKRLDDVTAFTKINLNEIYIDPEKVGAIPKNFQGRPILNPELVYEHSILPNIHDFHCFLNSPGLMNEKTSREKVENVVSFILSSEYQNLEPGYGVLYEPKNRKFYSAGWSLHLFNYFHKHPHHDKMLKSICFDRSNLLRLSLFSRSEKGRNHPWFKNNIHQLDSFKNENGLYKFSRDMIPQKNSGYWVSGKSLGLEEDRSTTKAIQIESTFRYYEITKQKNYV